MPLNRKNPAPASGTEGQDAGRIGPRLPDGGLRALRLVGTTFLGALAVVLAVIGAWIAGNQVRARFAEVATEQAAAPPSGRWVNAGDVDMFAQEWGGKEGPVIVLVHGTGAWSGTWFGTPAFLAASGWHVVALDLPPFGFTRIKVAAPDYRRAAQARRLLLAVHAITDRPVVLLGHSFGAGPALEAALDEPASVRRLVLVDPALGLGVHGEMAACRSAPARWPMDSPVARTAIVRSTVTVPALTGALLERFVHRTEVVTPDKLAQYRRPFVRQDFSARLGAWAARFANDDCEGAASVDADAVAAWSRQSALALIWGAEDAITPPAQGVALGRLTGTTPVFIPGVGHIPHIEDPARFHAALAAALAKTP
jgi:pimeloyl-ACP methyl ester carboxylesterase